jgi:hypothetical protein
MKMETESFYETLVTKYRATRRHIPDDNNLYIHSWENRDSISYSRTSDWNIMYRALSALNSSTINGFDCTTQTAFFKNLTASIKNLETAYMDSEGVKTRESCDPKGVRLINVSFFKPRSQFRSCRSCNLQCTEAETIYSHFRSLLAASAFPPRYAILLSFFPCTFPSAVSEIHEIYNKKI